MHEASGTSQSPSGTSRASGGSTTFPRLLRRNRDVHATKHVLVTESRAITQEGLDDASRSLAARLVAAGVGKGAHVGLLAPNSVDWAVTAAAVMRVGGVIVPLSTLLRPPELEAQLRLSGVTDLAPLASFRGREYCDDLDAIAPGVVEITRAGRRHRLLPSLRHVWAIDDVPSEALEHPLVG